MKFLLLKRSKCVTWFLFRPISLQWNTKTTGSKLIFYMVLKILKIDYAVKRERERERNKRKKRERDTENTKKRDRQTDRSKDRDRDRVRRKGQREREKGRETERTKEREGERERKKENERPLGKDRGKSLHLPYQKRSVFTPINTLTVYLFTTDITRYPETRLVFTRDRHWQMYLMLFEILCLSPPRRGVNAASHYLLIEINPRISPENLLTASNWCAVPLKKKALLKNSLHAFSKISNVQSSLN